MIGLNSNTRLAASQSLKMHSKTNNSHAPSYADLGAELLKKIGEYTRASGAKAVGEAIETLPSENEIAHIIARRGIIRNTAKTVEVAITNIGGGATVKLDESSVAYTADGPRYDIVVDPDGHALFVGRSIARALRHDCEYKCKWASRADGNITISIRKY